MKVLVQGHTASKGQSWDSDPVLSGLFLSTAPGLEWRGLGGVGVGGCAADTRPPATSPSQKEAAPRGMVLRAP